MKQISDKRAVQLRHYNRIKAELEEELKARGEWVCVFSGVPLNENEPAIFHHLIGRENDLLTDKKFLRPVLHEYHTMYHDQPFSKLKTMWWWSGFLQRVKAIDEDLWYSFSIK